MDFSKHFLLQFFSDKNFKFQNSVLHLFNFSNSYLTVIVEFQFLIPNPLEKHIKEEYIFSGFYSGKELSSNLAEFKSELQLFMGNYGDALSATIELNLLTKENGKLKYLA